jgi:hypothetical protein
MPNPDGSIAMERTLSLNILQYAVLNKAEKVVKYILQEHKVMTAAKQSR